MKSIRYLTILLLAMLWGVGAVAQDDFNPASPGDPGVPPQPLTLLVSPAGAGSVSGGGRIVPEAVAEVTARAYDNWQFVNWTDEQGNVLSTERTYRHTKQSRPETLTANFEFLPGSPSDPVPGTQLVWYRLTLETDGGGTASGGGRYQCGTTVRLRAERNAGFDFVAWVNEEGEVLSTDQTFYYTTQACNETLKATFLFNPDLPSEPVTPVMAYYVTPFAGEGGTVSGGGREVTGNSVVLTAYANAGYQFRGWYVDGELVSSDRQFAYTVGERSVRVEARFEFDPDSPGDPVTPTDKQYSLYIMSPITYPGRDVACQVYLSNLSPLGDMRFNLTFPETLTPDFGALSLGEAFEGYTASVVPSGEPCGYTVTLAGGTARPGNREMLSIPVRVPETTALGTGYQLKVNQVSVTQEDGSTCTASTRNGRVSIYKRGDTNGDGEVTVTDYVNIVKVMMTGDEDRDNFIKEVSDINEDGEFTVTDVVGITKIILSE